MLHNFLLLLAGLICVAIGMELAYIERGYFAIGIEYLFIFIPLGAEYIWEH